MILEIYTWKLRLWKWILFRSFMDIYPLEKLVNPQIYLNSSLKTAIIGR